MVVRAALQIAEEITLNMKIQLEMAALTTLIDELAHQGSFELENCQKRKVLENKSLLVKTTLLEY